MCLDKTDYIKRELKIYDVLKDNPFAVRLLEMVQDPENISNYGYVISFYKYFKNSRLCLICKWKTIELCIEN